tara:strand:+ start:2678 stop:3808 length:1131 start_codon:yes stop_codon:yes gene_type:complete
MKTTHKPKEKFYGLDHLRALAILLVLIFHYAYFFETPAWWPKFAKFGWTGVDLFFVLSGFLIASQLFLQVKKGEKISLKRFFIKRIFRIVPIYAVVVTAYYLFPILRERDTLPELWRYLTFTHNFDLDISKTNAFSHAWSLSVEEHFYLLLPLILSALQVKKQFKNSFYILGILFIAGFLLRDYLWFEQYLPNFDKTQIVPTWTRYIYFPTYNRLDGLLVGVAIAASYQFSPVLWKKISPYGNYFLGAGTATAVFCYFFCSDLATYATTVFGFPLIAIGYGFLVIGAICPSSVLYKWNSKVSSMIAMLSYGIYLTHKIAIHVAQNYFKNLGVDPKSGGMVLLAAATCLAIAWGLYIAVEKPFMKLRKHLLEKQSFR